MTLVDASNLITPILQSDLYRTNEILQKKVEEAKKIYHARKEHFTNFASLNQFTILDEPTETAFREIVVLYDELKKHGA